MALSALVARSGRRPVLAGADMDDTPLAPLVKLGLKKKVGDRYHVEENDKDVQQLVDRMQTGTCQRPAAAKRKRSAKEDSIQRCPALSIEPEDHVPISSASQGCPAVGLRFRLRSKQAPAATLASGSKRQKMELG